MIALGITTYQRPRYLQQTMKGVLKHLRPVVDRIYVYDDGSDARYHGEYQAIFDCFPSAVTAVHGRENRGVAFAKNQLLRWMLRDGADWCFLLEDDVVPQSPEAITGYIAACEASGWSHLAFHAHGPANNAGPLKVDGPVTMWPNSVGAAAIYGRESLEVGGLFDERFQNCWEHVVHSQHLATLGFTPAWPYNADATGSEQWLKEIPGSIEGSSIRPREDWQANVAAGREHWKASDPGTYRAVFGG